MADKLYKVNEVIEIGYQAPNKQSGLTDVVAEIYLPNKVKDSSFPDITLVEVGNSGTYRGAFTPDAHGVWQVIMHLGNGDGQVTKSYSVGGYNVDSVGQAVDAVESAVAIVDGRVVASEAAIRGGSDTLKTLSDQLDDIDSKVSVLDTPPMAF